LEAFETKRLFVKMRDDVQVCPRRCPGQLTEIRDDVQVNSQAHAETASYPQHVGFLRRPTHDNVVGMGDLVQLSLFTVSTVDPPWRDNRDAMAYPLLSLEKRRTTPIKYQRKGVSIGVHAPAEFGIATIWDWDLVIFASSHLNQAIEDGRKPAPRISFVPTTA
jgi:hypothetical protein